MDRIKLQVLLADDDSVFRGLLCDILTQQGYQVLQAADGQQAIDQFFSCSQTLDLLILDVLMPVYDGWEVLREIRAHSQIPVLMLTALSDEQSEIHGLTLGADDYIHKPFSYDLLLARLSALTRKICGQREQSLCAGHILVEQATRRVLLEQTELPLNNKEYQLLVYLIRNAGLALSREMILNRVWGYDFDGDIRTIDTHIKTLRAKLSRCSEYIQTVRGSGYRFAVKE